MSFNQQIIVGRLCRTPELKQSSRGSATELSVATTYKYKEQEETEWHVVVLYDKAAENACKYLEKGRQVFIKGRTKTQKWKNKMGDERSRKVIECESIIYLGDNKSRSSDATSTADQRPSSPSGEGKLGGW